MSDASVGWSRFTKTTMRCPTCAVGAVDTQQEARTRIPAIRKEMAAVGIELAIRVRVELRDADSINVAGSGSSMRLGLTHTRLWSDRTAEVLGIEIARGLPATQFGQAVAHEIGHAWLFQKGAVNLEQTLEEGVCELFAGAWLKRCPTAIAPALRDAMLTNPDPVYGEGYRMVRNAVIKHGIATVLDTVCRRGSLP
jgi:hypothetical protein